MHFIFERHTKYKIYRGSFHSVKYSSFTLHMYNGTDKQNTN